MSEHDLKQDIEDMESLAEILETLEVSSGAKLRRVIEAARPAEEDELYELRNLFELHWDCSRRAIKIWQEKTGKKGVWPDKTDLLVFLMDMIEGEWESMDTAPKDGSDFLIRKVSPAITEHWTARYGPPVKEEGPDGIEWAGHEWVLNDVDDVIGVDEEDSAYEWKPIS